MALRYLLRRRITLMAGMVMALGVAVMVIVFSIINGYLNKYEEIIRGDTADLILQMQSYDPICDTPQIMEKLSALPEVEACSPVIRENVIISYKGLHFNFCEVVGIDPAYEVRVGRFAEYFEPDVNIEELFGPPGTNQIVIGDCVIQAEGIAKGEEIEVFSVPGKRQRSSMVVKNYTIDEFVHSGFFQTDGMRCYMSLENARKLTGLGTGQVTEIKIQLKDPKSPLKAMYAIAATLGAPRMTVRGGEGAFEGDFRVNFSTAYTLRTWRVMHRNELGAIRNDLRVLSLIVLFIIIGAGFVVMAILVMMVFEKRKDIGIIKSVGGTGQGTILLFVLMGVFIGVLGIVLGVALGSLAANNINEIADFFEARFGVTLFDKEVYKLDEIPAEIVFSDVVYIGALAMLVSVLSSSIAAFRAASIHPVKALRYE